MYVHSILLRQPAPFDLLVVQEKHVASIVYTSIAIVIAIDGRVVLIVAANSAQPEDLRIVLMSIFIEPLEQHEVSLAV